MLAKEFGQRLRALREERFLSQRQVAEGIGTETTQISRYERGVVMPAAETIIDLAGFFRVGVGKLLVGKEETSSGAQPIQDSYLLERFRDLEKLERKDREMVIALIDAVIASRQHEQVSARRPRRTA